MERIIYWWANNPVAANLLMVGILLAGVLGFFAMEREAFPIFKANEVEIQIAWPGAAPQEVEEQILMRIEQALNSLDSIYRVHSTAEEGLGSLQVQTYPGVNINEFVNDVKMVVDSVNSLPRDIEKPQVRRVEYRNEMIRIVVHGELRERELNRLAEDLRDEVAALPYISIVELFGTRREEVTIELSEEALGRYSLSFAEVASAIRGSSINLSSGRIKTETGDVLLRARNLADTEDEFASIVIRQTADGGIVRIGDVARVVDGFEDYEILATMNGEPAVLLQVLSTENNQVVKASDAVRAWMKAKAAELPPGVNLSIWFDSADVYKSRMGTINDSAILGLFLVFMVLILSLRPKVALWVTAGIAIAFMGTFSMLPGNDVSLNIMSTFAFLLVLGIVVDDAIVVGESIHQYNHMPGIGTNAAVKGASAVAKPVICSVLTTMIAFAPWFFLNSEAAQMTRQFSIVITVALTISLIEAFLILPAHLKKMEPRKALHGLALWQKKIEQSIVDFARGTYRRWITAAINQRYLTASIFIAAFTISLGVFSSGWVKFAFMPEVEDELIWLNVELPTGTPYSRALTVLDQLQEAELKLIDEVNERARTDGGTGKLIEGWYTRSRRDSVIAIIKLSPPEVRDMSAKEAALRLRELVGDIPDADQIQVNYTMNNSGPQVNYVLRHRDLEMLQTASNELKAQLYSYDGTYYVRDNMRGESDELLMQLLPGAEKLGITLAQVSLQVRQAYFGEEVQRLPRENGDVKVMVRYPKELRYNLESLNNFRIRTDDGREIPLLSVVEVEVARGVQAIQRRDGERMVRVSAEVGDGLMSDITRDMKDNFLPEFEKRYPELSIGIAGQAEAEEEFLNEILALYAVALFVMYALIAVAFHSYWLPLIIMTAIPFAFMGAVYGHLLFGVSMAMFSYFGIGAAAGVVVNDNLVLVNYIGRLQDEGKSAFDAVIEAGVVRFRPILLTSVTTFVGLMPIMMARSTDAQFLKPAVLALAFGVLFALFVTLLMVPALYSIGEDASRAIQAVKRRLFEFKAAIGTANNVN
ncbi:MAG: efflux RND transporter permease subunit [Gammaproteobacteria bacterium]|nr:efflux RND transporter permease subunit [Gammaproteobacteria bacterium]